MNDKGQKVAIITGGSQDIGATLITAYRRQGWRVVGTARTMKPTEDPDVLTVDGDLADPATANRRHRAGRDRHRAVRRLVRRTVGRAGPYTWNVSLDAVRSAAAYWVQHGSPRPVADARPQAAARLLAKYALEAAGGEQFSRRGAEVQAVINDQNPVRNVANTGG